MSSKIKLIVGLGNPGLEYSDTRHNAGFWFLDRLIATQSASFSHNKKFFGETARFNLEGNDCWVLKPETFMNNSGRSIQTMTDYYGIKPNETLVAHDEIDLEVGMVRIKESGGHGGHNGLKDIIDRIGYKEFLRLRIGVGHPGHKDDVIDYVLNKPGRTDGIIIREAIDRALEIIPLLFRGERNKAMTLLNSARRQDIKDG